MSVRKEKGWKKSTENQNILFLCWDCRHPYGRVNGEMKRGYM